MKYHSSRRKTVFYLNRESMKTKRLKTVSLETAFEGFLEACEARALSVHTVEDYSRTIKKFIRFAGNMTMQDVTSRHITAFLASLRSVGAKTILNRHIGLAAFWTWAMKQDPPFIDRHVVRMVDKPRPKRILIDPFPEMEVRALLSVMRNKPVRDRAIIYLLLDTGMRASELVGIERKDINFTTNKVKVLGKGNKERLLPFSDRTAKALSRHLASTVGMPFPFSRTTLTSIVARLGERAGVNDCYPHRFRHTFAIEYLRNNGDPYTLQFLLDHSTMTMVARYVKIAQIDIDRVHRKASPVENWRL